MIINRCLTPRMINIFSTEFEKRTPYDNYRYLLCRIDFQMMTDETFFAHHGHVIKYEINYYLSQMTDNTAYDKFLNKISWILPILEDKVFNQDFGFGTNKDYELYLATRDKLLEEIAYRGTVCICNALQDNEAYQCWRCIVRDGGSKARYPSKA